MKNTLITSIMVIVSILGWLGVSLTHNNNYTNPNQQYFEQLSYGTWTVLHISQR